MDPPLVELQIRKLSWQKFNIYLLNLNAQILLKKKNHITGTVHHIARVHGTTGNVHRVDTVHLPVLFIENR